MTTPFVRGPLRLAEAFAVLPDVRRALPEARFPFERPRVAVAVVAGAAAAGIARRSQLGFLAHGEPIAAFASLAPAVIALRGGELASYHGAEHISIGTYETGEPATKEHDRCGGHLVGPLLADERRRERAGGAGSRLGPPGRARARRGRRGGRRGRDLRLDGPPSASSRSRARSRVPATILQARISTAEPSAAQLEVAEAALAACLAGRRGGVSTTLQVRGERLDPTCSTSPSRRCGRATTPTRTSTTPARRCSPTAATRAS